MNTFDISLFFTVTNNNYCKYLSSSLPQITVPAVISVAAANTDLITLRSNGVYEQTIIKASLFSTDIKSKFSLSCGYKNTISASRISTAFDKAADSLYKECKKIFGGDECNAGVLDFSFIAIDSVTPISSSKPFDTSVYTERLYFRLMQNIKRDLIKYAEENPGSLYENKGINRYLPRYSVYKYLSAEHKSAIKN